MKIVSNTSPLAYLLLIDQDELLYELFGQIIIPQAVSLELADKGAPDVIRRWIAEPPLWLTIEAVTVEVDPVLDRLHAGEKEAIVLAQELGADLIILDEKQAREVAKERGLNVTGLLGVLDEAATKGLVDLPTVIENLRKTSFRVSPSMLKMLLDRHFHLGNQE